MKDFPAFPTQPLDAQGNPSGEHFYGLSIRQYFAIAALQGMISNSLLAGAATTNAARNGLSIEEMQTKCAVVYADALIAELSKS